MNLELLWQFNDLFFISLVNESNKFRMKYKGDYYDLDAMYCGF